MSRSSQIFQTNHKALDPLKMQLCLAIEIVCLRNQWTQRQSAVYMGTSRANLSRVQNKKLERLTVNQLFGYLSKICPDFRFMISVDTSLFKSQ